ncbi:MAG: hypothetical protein U9N62_00505 [Thermotogota bacterium]|nr:hypothetical protein [Thermotogota bacterium]
MKRNIIVFASIVVILASAFVITSCRVPGPDIGYPSVHYLTDTEVHLYWDYENQARPFTVYFKESDAVEYTVVATNLQAPPVNRDVESGKTYDWKIEGGNGSTGGSWSFTVP